MPQEAACDASFFDKLQRFLMPLLLLAVALLGCSITKNIAVFYQTVRTMSMWEIILFSIPMAVFSGILLFVLYKLIVLMGHLRAFTQISGKALQELRGRENLRKLCIQREGEARQKRNHCWAIIARTGNGFPNMLTNTRIKSMRLPKTSSAVIHGKPPPPPPPRRSSHWIKSSFWQPVSPC